MPFTDYKSLQKKKTGLHKHLLKNLLSSEYTGFLFFYQYNTVNILTLLPVKIAHRLKTLWIEIKLKFILDDSKVSRWNLIPIVFQQFHSSLKSASNN